MCQIYHFIVNPTSKSGRGAKIWAEIEPLLKRKKVPYQVYFSGHSGHVIEIVRSLCAAEIQAVSDESNTAEGNMPLSEPPALLKLVALGGDGTLNEVIQGISDFSRVQVGYIPTGSSNDMARDLQLPSDPAALLDRILSCRSAVPMDLGSVTYETCSDELSRRHGDEFLQKRYFAVSCGIGFDAAVCEEALSSQIKNILNRIGLGKLTYLGIALRQLIAAKKISCDIFIEEKEPIHMPRFLFVAGMIHQYEGGGFKFCPGADCHDGRLDVCAAGDIPKWLILLALPTAFKGNHYRFNGIDKYMGKKIRLKTSAPLWVHTDGEVSVKASEITLDCETDKLQMLI